MERTERQRDGARLLVLNARAILNASAQSLIASPYFASAFSFSPLEMASSIVPTM
jgi:hypothetical protein